MTELLLLPGWGFDGRVWQPLAERLAGCRLHFDPARAPEDAVVCGWSLGALRALRLALDRPERVARLVLIGATPRFVQAPDWPQAQPASLLEGFAAAVTADPDAALRRFAALLNQGDSQARALTRRLHGLLSKARPPADDLAAGLAELRDTDLRRDLGRVAQPTLLLHGEHDPLMPLSAARRLAEMLPRGRLEVVADAAHAPFLARPEHCAALILDFVHG
jgi:pimeloyl-[acyl-carrier protein] methyl ester esterase